MSCCLDLMFKKVRDFLYSVDVKKIYSVSYLNVTSSINSLFCCCIDENKIVVKLYNKIWLESNFCIKENIKKSINYNKICKKLDVNCVDPWFDDLVFFDGNYWQVFDFIENKDKRFNFLDVYNLSYKMFFKEKNYFSSYKMLKLKYDQQKNSNKIDKLLSKWLNIDFNIPFEGIAHRDLRENNLIYNNTIYVIDFDFSGPRSKIVDDLAIALDFGLFNIPQQLLDKYTIKEMKEALSSLVYEWRCWYNQLFFLAPLCKKSEVVLYKQLYHLEKITIKQLDNWFSK